eukprot:scaffold42449_cov25-Tisochrysis_lutea.AAC.4
MHLAVVAKDEVDEVLEPGLAHAPAAFGELLLRDGDAGAGAPAAADFQHVLARLKLGGGDHRVDLLVLRRLERALLGRVVEVA